MRPWHGRMLIFNLHVVMSVPCVHGPCVLPNVWAPMSATVSVSFMPMRPKVSRTVTCKKTSRAVSDDHALCAHTMESTTSKTGIRESAHLQHTTGAFYRCFDFVWNPHWPFGVKVDKP